MTPQERAREALEATRADGGEDEELEERLEEEARASRSAVRPIRDVPDQYVFRFEVGPAILAMLLEKLEHIPRTPLLQSLDARYPGFYQLFLRGEPKYIGKTARPVGVRLKEHVSKLYGRQGIDLADMECRYAFVEDPSLVDVAEGALIAFFSERGMADWNTSGFGSKVPGHGRGGQRASAWAEVYPPDLRLPIGAGHEAPITIFLLAQQIIKEAPITLSIPTQFRAAFKAAHSAPRAIPFAELPFEEWVRYLEGRLEPGWIVDRKPSGWYIVQA